MDDNQDHFNVLRQINRKPKSTQRELAEGLGFSLGKLNYCLKALKSKGLIKMKNFNTIKNVNQKTPQEVHTFFEALKGKTTMESLRIVSELENYIISRSVLK